MNYETVIGLEIHAELATKTKIYCSCENSFGGAENTRTCPVCLGLPGALPVLNKTVVDYCIKAGLALNCSISKISKQDRKNYCYPDLPKAYQISQFDLPIATNGFVEITVGDEKKKIGITRIHIEEDAGKMTHHYDGTSHIDYNRSGVPLIEIVTEPDLRSSEEAFIFLNTLKDILKTIGVSDCKMEEGSLRCDVNLSLRPFGQKEYGARSEIKNVNSFKSAVLGMEYEKERQTKLLESGQVVLQETRRFDDALSKTVPLRSKEEAQDYRYFPEPDLMPLSISDEWVLSIKETLPELPEEKKARFMESFGLNDYDATTLVSSSVSSALFEEGVKEGAEPKTLANWILGDVSKEINERALSSVPFEAKDLVSLISLIDSKKITGTIAKQVLTKMFETKKAPEDIVKEEGLSQISDEGAIVDMIKAVIEKNPNAVSDFKAGKDRAIGFLTGQVMRESKGKANPQLLGKLLRDILSQM